MEAIVLSGEPVSPPRAMLVTGLSELPPEVCPANDPAHTHNIQHQYTSTSCNKHRVFTLSQPLSWAARQVT